MGTRRNIGGRYVEVRDKNTPKGKKGTIMKNWSSKKRNSKKRRVPIKIYRDSGLVILIIILLLLSYKYLI